ncbi:MAG TPA: type II secretion system protein [Bryobacteraceae bacterium]|jgi:general secretion pathway protein I
MNRKGFTLLEIMVATTLMGIAVVGVLSSLSTSMRNASHVSDADRAAQMARNKMEELMSDANLPFQANLQGAFDASSGWTAQIAPYETPQTQPGALILQRISLVVWWKSGSNLRQFPLESYRMAQIPRPQQ